MELTKSVSGLLQMIIISLRGNARFLLDRLDKEYFSWKIVGWLFHPEWEDRCKVNFQSNLNSCYTLQRANFLLRRKNSDTIKWKINMQIKILFSDCSRRPLHPQSRCSSSWSQAFQHHVRQPPGRLQPPDHWLWSGGAAGGGQRARDHEDVRDTGVHESGGYGLQARVESFRWEDVLLRFCWTFFSIISWNCWQPDFQEHIFQKLLTSIKK